MKTTSTFLRNRLSALLLGLVLSAGALAAPLPAEACGPYGPVLSAEEREVVNAAEGRLPADGTVFVLSYGKVRIDDDRALVSLELWDSNREASFWRTFRFVRGEDGWRPAVRRHA